MKPSLYALGLLAAAIGGCVAQPLFVPPAAAGSSDTRWDYFCFGASGASEVQENSKSAGKERWEMVGLGPAAQGSQQVVCFKRPL